MKTEIVKFYGKEIPCVNVENVIMIGVKPICENIGLDYRAQCDAIKNDEILCQLVGVHHIVAADGKEREMNCLPLDFVPGWLFQIKFTNTMVDETKQMLNRYKLECHKVLSNHFFGNVKRQLETNAAEIELFEKINELNETKNRAALELRENKLKLEKIRAERLKNEPTLFD